MTSHQPTRQRRAPSTAEGPADERHSFFGRRDFDLSRDYLCILGFDGTFKQANDALVELVACDRDALIGRRAAECVHPDDWQRTAAEARRLAAGGHATHGFENRCRTQAGGWVWLEWTARAVPAEGLIYASARDVTAKKVREADLERAALVDPLTGLANRRGFERALERELAAARRHDHRPALVVVDLDHFKEINDRHGHVAGDELLVTAARTLESTVRASDLPARLGGDEFAVLIPDSDLETAQLVARKVVDALGGSALEDDGDGPEISASAGVALLGQRDIDSATDLMTAADRAMYRAKRMPRRSAYALHDAPLG